MLQNPVTHRAAKHAAAPRLDGHGDDRPRPRGGRHPRNRDHRYRQRTQRDLGRAGAGRFATGGGTCPHGRVEHRAPHRLRTHRPRAAARRAAHRSRGADAGLSRAAYDTGHVAALRQYDLAGPAVPHQVHAGSRGLPALPDHRRLQHQGTRVPLAPGTHLAKTEGQCPPRAGGHSRVDRRTQVLPGAVLPHPLFAWPFAWRARAQSMCSATISSASARRWRSRSTSFFP